MIPLSRSDEHKRSVRNCDCDKNETAKHCWEADHNLTGIRRKLLIGKAGKFLGRSEKPYIL